MQVLKALYVCIKLVLLWYELFLGTLVEMGFELNPYGNCVPNKMIDGNQCTIIWWVDDNYINHMSGGVLDMVIGAIKAKFGKMKVTRGKEHVFLRTNLRFPSDDTVWIKMKEYIEEAITMFGEKLTRSAVTPATKQSFVLDPNAKVLSESQRERLQSISGQLSWAYKHGRPDVDLSVAYLCTRVSNQSNLAWWNTRVTKENKTRENREYDNGHGKYRDTPWSRRTIQMKNKRSARINITNGQTGSWGTSCGHVNRGTS